jgi:uncharacterized damage-inducible protein DinB
MQVQEFIRLFAYNHWANIEVLKSLKATETAPYKALALLAHVIAAEQLWLDRLQNGDAKIAVWPELTVGQCETQLGELNSTWTDYLDGLKQNSLTDTVSYTNTKGEFFTDTVSDVLMHVVMHGAYHRGQIALSLRQSGHTPPYTDFIHAVRSGLVE